MEILMKTYLGAFAELDETDYSILEKFISECATYFGYSADGILKHEFIKLFPCWLRPYGRLYAY